MYSFSDKKSDNSPTLRIGQVVPPGDVNLAYIYVPPLRVEENVQIVDCSGAFINNLLSPFKGLATADLTGLLCLDASKIFPTQHLVLTDIFHDNVHEISQALFYRYDFVHYDLLAVAGKYTGNFITMVDGDGLPLLSDEYYEVYLQATDTPHVFNATVYASFNTSAGRTYRIRYNKVSGGQVTFGYEEIFNGQPVYSRATPAEVFDLPASKIFAVSQVPEGYHIYVPQRAQIDPRDRHYFRWRVKGVDINSNEYTPGWVSDCIFPSDCLLTLEQADYNPDGAKKLTLAGRSVQEMVQLALPPGFSGTISSYVVESDNPDVSVSITSPSEPARATTTLSSSPWSLAESYTFDSRPIEFTYTVYPKKSVTTRNWTWEAFGWGYLNGEIWSTDDNGANVQGTAVASYGGADWSTTLTPATLPATPSNMPPEVQGFEWKGIRWAEPGVLMWIDNNNVQVSVEASSYRDIGRPVTFKNSVNKDEGLKYLVDIATIVDACTIPDNIDPAAVYLFIETDEVRVNLRWYKVDRFVTDQNYARLSDLQPGGQIIAWTAFYNLTAAPVFAVKSDEELKHIYVVHPTPAEVELDRWYLRVRDGAFNYNLVLPAVANYEACSELRPYIGQNVTLRYALPEYLRQPFEPDIPFMRVSGGLLERVEEHILRAPHTLLFSVERVVANPSTVNERVLTVEDVDKTKGLIYIGESVYPEDVVVGDYIYKNMYYEYQGYNAFNNFFHLNLNPSCGTFTVLQNGDSIVIPGDFPSANVGQLAEVATENLLSLCIYLYLRPVVVLCNNEVVPGSVRYSTLFHTTEGAYFDPTSPLYDPSAFLLARIYVRPNSSPRDVVVLDARTRGGGLKDDYEGKDYWDVGMADGIPYPSQGVVLVRLPQSILKENGGRFTKEEVERIVRTYLAYGVHPVIEYF